MVLNKSEVRDMPGSNNKPIKPDELMKRLERIERKIDVLARDIGSKRPPKRAVAEEISEPIDVMTLLSLPDHLRKSAMSIVKLGKAMAEDVAKETGRARAIESAYLNQLARMGHLRRTREGRRVYFLAEDDLHGGKGSQSSKRGAFT
jgi:hypothetical protein